MTGTANDNDSPERFPRGDAVGFRALVLEKRREYQTIHQAPDEMLLVDEIKSSFWTLLLALIAWGIGLCALAWSFYTSQPVGVRILCATGLTSASLWATAMAQDHRKPRMAELSILTALIGFIGLMLTASTQLGFPMTMGRGITLFCLAALIVSFLTESRMALLASISACLCWAALQMDGYLPASLILLVLPIVWISQVFMAIRVNSPTAAFASIMCAYVWIVGTSYMQYTQGNLSLLFLVGGTAVLAALHYCVASTAHEAGRKGMPLHIVFSWLLALTALLGIQHYCLSPNDMIWADADKNDTLLRFGWLFVMLISIALIGVTGLLRQRFGRLNFATNLMLTTAIALIPAIVWFNPIIGSQENLSNALSPLPVIGMFLAGVIFVAATAFTVRQFRAGHPFLGLSGVLILGLEASLSLKTEFLTGNYVTMLMSGAFLSLAFMNLLAQGEHNPHRVRRPLKYMNEA